MLYVEIEEKNSEKRKGKRLTKEKKEKKTKED